MSTGPQDPTVNGAGPAPEPPPPPAPAPGPMALGDFIRYAERVLALAARAMQSPPEGSYYVVIGPPTGLIRCHKFADLEGALAVLRPLYGLETQVFVFLGRRLGISKGGQYLFTPQGPFPLFAEHAPGEEDDDGFMGDAPQLVQPAPVAVEEDEDDLDGTAGLDEEDEE